MMKTNKMMKTKMKIKMMTKTMMMKTQMMKMMMKKIKFQPLKKENLKLQPKQKLLSKNLLPSPPLAKKIKNHVARNLKKDKNFDQFK